VFVHNGTAQKVKKEIQIIRVIGNVNFCADSTL